MPAPDSSSRIADVTIVDLEVTRETFLPRKLENMGGVTFARVKPAMPWLNRSLYLAIGGPMYWIERRSWTEQQWNAAIVKDTLDTWLLTVRGVPAGYVELEKKGDGVVEIVYFGLLNAFIGQGYGAHMLTAAVERAFASGAQRVIVNTCNLDHPNALGNYKARGFREIRSTVWKKELPATAPGEWQDTFDVPGARALLRHSVAIVAYRGAKAIRGAPASFADFKVGPESRTPIQILAHIGDLYDWALSLAKGDEKWNNAVPSSWDKEVARFHAALAAFDAHLASGAGVHWSAERLMAGPVADSLQHIGQLTMLRRLAGSPIKGENYSRAEIVAGRVGPEQAKPGREF